MSIELTIINKELIDDYWQLVNHWIEEACHRNPQELSIGEVYHNCLTGEMQLWLACDTEECEALGCMVTSVRLGSDGSRFAYINIATGKDMNRWVHLFEELKKIAKREGLTRIVSLARLGWKKALKNTGARVRHIEMVWDL